MIPDIGVMIAAYIVTRMAAPLGQPHSDANPVAKFFALATAIVAIATAADLIMKGSSINLHSLS